MMTQWTSQYQVNDCSLQVLIDCVSLWPGKLSKVHRSAHSLVGNLGYVSEVKTNADAALVQWLR